MLLKYFEYIFLFLIIGTLIAPMVLWYRQSRIKYLQKLVRINVLRRQQKYERDVFFSSDILNQCVKLLYNTFDKKAHLALAFLAGGYVLNAHLYLKQKEPLLSMLLCAHYDMRTVYRKMKNKKRIWYDSKKFYVYFPIIAHLAFDNKSFLLSVAKIQKEHMKSKRNLAYYNYISAYAYLYQGDMLSASQNASAALKAFQKFKYSAEEASCYLLLAEIYRISCVTDIAYTMIESALKIYQPQNLAFLTAKALAVWGTLMLFENRYQEAEDKYFKALKKSPLVSFKADIYNQLALLFLVQNKLKDASYYAKLSLKGHEKSKNYYGCALSLQLLGQIYFAKHHYNKTREYTANAAELYYKQYNFSAFCECLYLGAEAYYKQNNMVMAEKLLRKILDVRQKHTNNFHVANAYSLLGLIYLRLNDLQRSKVLFQQSLHLEQSNNRCEGMLSDYANLAMIEQINGDINSALSNLKIALEYAEKTSNQELIDLIENKLKHFT